MLTKLVAGFVLAWLVLDRTAALSGSLRGEAGLWVGAVAVLATLLVEMLLFRQSFGEALSLLGFGKPAPRALLAASAVSLLMLAFYPVFARLTGSALGLYDGWPWLLPGLFAQGRCCRGVFVSRLSVRSSAADANLPARGAAFRCRRSWRFTSSCSPTWTRRLQPLPRSWPWSYRSRWRVFSTWVGERSGHPPSCTA